MHEFSDQIKWINTKPKEQRSRRLKEMTEINNLPNLSEKIYHTNLADDYYPNRPDSLKNVCLRYVVEWFEYTTTKCSPSHQECLTLKNNLGFLHKKSKPKLIKTQNIKPVDADSTEQYFHQLLFLFKPWRNEIYDLKQNFKTYEESFRNSVNNKSINDCLLTEFQDKKTKINKSIEFANELIEKAKIAVESDDEQNNDYLLQTKKYCQQLLNLGVGYL